MDMLPAAAAKDLLALKAKNARLEVKRNFFSHRVATDLEQNS